MKKLIATFVNDYQGEYAKSILADIIEIDPSASTGRVGWGETWGIWVDAS